MKKIILSLLLLASISSYCQDKPNGTTLEEYNYMTKGYQIQISSGLDVKKGYRIEDLYSFDANPYNFVFKAFVRDNNTLAGIILVSTSKLWGNVYYSAIPVNNDELLANFNSRLDTWDEPMVTAYGYASTTLMSNLYNIYFDSLHRK